VPLQEEFGRVLRVVLRNAVALACAQAELRELERDVFPQRAVALALIFLQIGIGIVVFVRDFQVVALGRLVPKNPSNTFPTTYSIVSVCVDPSRRGIDFVLRKKCLGVPSELVPLGKGNPGMPWLFEMIVPLTENIDLSET